MDSNPYSTQDKYQQQQQQTVSQASSYSPSPTPSRSASRDQNKAASASRSQQASTVAAAAGNMHHTLSSSQQQYHTNAADWTSHVLAKSSSSSPYSAAGAAFGTSGGGPNRSASTSANASAVPSASASAAGSRPHGRHRRHRDRHLLALDSIRNFLKERSSYDVLPVSFRLIVLDTQLVVGPALEVMFGAGVVSAPLWHSIAATDLRQPSSAGGQDAASDITPTPSATTTSTTATTPATTSTTAHLMEPASAPAAPTSSFQRPPPLRPLGHSMKPGFAGMLTVNDIIHLIQYYYQHSSYETAKKEVDSFRLESLREIEAKLAVPPPPLLSCHPLRPLFEACQLLMKTHARRLPLLDHDEQTGIETVVSVLTQYRVLKFIAMNCRETASLHRSIRSLGIGTYVASYTPVPGSKEGSRRTSEANTTSVSAGEREAAAGPSSSKPPSPSPAPAVNTSVPAETSVGELATPTNEDTPRQELKEEQLHLTEHVKTTPSTTTTTTSPLEMPPTSPKSGNAAKLNPAANSNPHYPLHTATLDTTVFDVVHMFSERGISAVPIVDEEGYAVDMYESVDVITLVRTGAYQDLDLTIRQALSRRSSDFPGIYSCSPDDSVANIFALLRKRRVHRLLIVEPLSPSKQLSTPGELEEQLENDNATVRQKGRLVGILALSDLLRHIIGLPSIPPPHLPKPGNSASGSGTPSVDTPLMEQRDSNSSSASTAAEENQKSNSSTTLSNAEVIPPSTQMQANTVEEAIPEESPKEDS
ncbi:unnamed protein product [Sympodiomycopsis kandeliae]